MPELVMFDKRRLSASPKANLTKSRKDNRSINVGRIARDMTADGEVGDASNESERLLLKLCEKFEHVLWIASPDLGEVIYISPAYEKIWGRSRDSLYSCPSSWLDAVHKDDRERVITSLKRTKCGDLRNAEFHEYRVVRPDGSVRWISARAFLIRNENGKVHKLSGIAEDITRMKKAEERLVECQKRLPAMASALSLAEESERRRIAGEVHDRIGHNLAFVKIRLTNLLVSTSYNRTRKQVEETIELVNQAIKDTRSLVSEFGSSILLELGFVRAVEHLSRQILISQGIALTLQDDGKPKPLSDYLRILLFQAVRELLVNVIKHAQASRARVSIARKGGLVCVDVEDDGVGFDVERIGPGVNQNLHFGLLSIRERLESVGGWMKIFSQPFYGTQVALSAPLDIGPDKEK